MTEPHEREPERDERLERHFRELREHDARRAPPFSRERRRRTRWFFAGSAGFAMAAAAAVAVLAIRSVAPRSTPPRGPKVVPTVVALRIDEPPLDFLLDSPQADFLGQTPSFDAPPPEPRP